MKFRIRVICLLPVGVIISVIKPRYGDNPDHILFAINIVSLPRHGARLPNRPSVNKNKENCIFSAINALYFGNEFVGNDQARYVIAHIRTTFLTRLNLIAVTSIDSKLFRRRRPFAVSDRISRTRIYQGAPDLLIRPVRDSLPLATSP